jgi:putative redox protein
MAKITTYYKGDMLFESKLGNHRILIDVPAGMGGGDRGPTPPEVFIASLGSCVGAFVAKYCNHAGVDPQNMSVDVTYDKVEHPTRLVNLKVKVNLPNGKCKGGRKKALLRAAEHCPVHETISTLENIDFELVQQPERVNSPEEMTVV